MKKRMLMCCVVMMLCGLASASTTITGDVDPYDPLNWGSAVNVSVGKDSAGSLTMDGGSTIASSYSNIGVNAAGVGTVSLDGTGTKWTSGNGFRPGYSGTALVTVSGGAVVDSLYTILGYNSGSSGTIVVDGIGSKLSTSNYYIRVGGNGSGLLKVLNGGLVDVVGYGGISYGNGSEGNVLVSGSGSTWKMTGDLYVGRLDDGNLSIFDGGLVSVGGAASIDAYAEGNAASIKMGNNGQLALCGDGSVSIAAFMDLVGGTDEITYWNGSIWDNIANGVSGTDYTLSAGTGDLAGYSTLTVTAVTPEPATLGLLAVGALGMLGRRQKK